ncbi:DUF3973 domain-containing protein [Paenibacillus mucilaginosus]|uniref:DUF3973 domain-containing protein n=3 Tax=Paenibacillus mucilaginosus TaxID=61624 RepID=H6NB89_9BACL|nr:DUF3973 domain-containing protein [Paenibacillus mucilaginosus]AEI42516.1 hypothetical protein KNP414_03979 [Paenibacillus mucilaginosus KNP414]AFC32057.1 hypothetical protein PM3016_5354 [Paenibacillus mucilaginosus 3016]AFH64427.1 hypothetical protein B2K_27665 [Paenibacillus mucilaginosus K02]MCG7213909.1 DUF3973 domain-containing protein [Paenibacillus mucilaginosus]WDM25914.1 DUF3973 domain-containing protein [Paenibacillus mucilaginosus]
MYYCIVCKQLHSSESSPDHMVFTTGFHYVHDNLYRAGMCVRLSKRAETPAPVNVLQSTSA